MSTEKRVPVAFLLCLFFISFLSAGSPPSASKEDVKALEVREVLGIESAGDFDICPGGSAAAWVRTTASWKANRRVRNVMITFGEDTLSLELTRGEDDSYSPRFSPDGSKLAFLKSSKGKASIHLYDMKGGAPEKIGGIKGSVRSFEWRGAGEIVFSAAEDSTYREMKFREDKDDAVVVADQEHYKPVRLFSLDTGSKKVSRITFDRGVISEFSISPDGRYAVYSLNTDIDYQYDNRIPPSQFLFDFSSGKAREIFIEPHVDPYRFIWDNGSEGFFCSRAVSSDSTDDYVSISHLYYYSLDGGHLEKVTGFHERGLGGPCLMSKDGLIAHLADGTLSSIALIRKSRKGFTGVYIESPSGMQAWVRGADREGRTVIYETSDASTVPFLMRGEIRGKEIRNVKPFTKLNGNISGRAFSRSEVISWTGALDENVEGILYYPPGYKEGRKYPLMVSLHGGPAGADRDYFSERWSNYPHLLSAEGAFVLKVNYHGSGNYGLDWVESIKGHYYEYEVPDILIGIDHLISKGIVDPERIGIMGWSNGSILAIECCLRSDMFKVLCAGAGDVNWTSDYGNCAFGAGFDNAYFGGPPWEIPEKYMEKSPLFRMEGLKTPTLIMFGDRDTNVPTGQGWEHFRAMQQIGAAPVRFILFPGAAHGPSKLSHQKRKMEEELTWIRRYLFGKESGDNEAFDKKSPLASAIMRAKALRDGALLGERTGGVLIPETAMFGGVKIGRFEVTSAQYAGFDPEYPYETGRGNHPAGGITFEEARDYCAWLSEKTGRKFRLPTSGEMEKMLSAVKGNLTYENNLDYWAGYDTTPEDRALLAEKVEELEKSRHLIFEAGSFRPLGDEGIFDLGGNVAEWTAANDGTGRVMGLSAVSPRDPRLPYAPPPAAYIGFRVVEEQAGEDKE